MMVIEYFVIECCYGRGSSPILHIKLQLSVISNYQRIPISDTAGISCANVTSTSNNGPTSCSTKDMDLSYVMETVDDNTPEPTTTDEGDDDDKVEGLDER